MSANWIVLTSINPPTTAINAISRLTSSGWRAVVVGDRKTPINWVCPGVDYLSIDDQKKLFGPLANIIPYDHYSRKNLGYLYAISHGATRILETDDDNIPYLEFGSNLSEELTINTVSGRTWINIYKNFTSEHIWPRGLPLDEINSVGEVSERPAFRSYPIQQYLADGDPDVDAVYRLIFNREITFERNPPLGIDNGCWVPFNSQNTLFYSKAFPLLYLPCHVSFRMTDIWRSFVAQQALWVQDSGIAFHSATVKQVRNPHNLMRDFIDEIPGYIDNKKIINTLEECAKSLSSLDDMPRVALALWQALERSKIIPTIELSIIEGWMAALAELDKAIE